MTRVVAYLTLAVALTATAAAAGFSSAPNDGIIVFTEGWSSSLAGPSGSALCGVDTSGRTFRFATSEFAQYTEPSLAPGGSMIVAALSTRAHNGIGEHRIIAAVDLLRGDSRQLLGDAEWPALSPSGQTLAFQAPSLAGHPASEGGVFTAAPDGSAQRRIASGLGPIAWSPDGTQLAYASSGAILISQADGSAQRELLKAPFVQSIDWSPDSGALLLVAASSLPGAIETVSVNGQDRRPLAPDLNALAAAWSPDGTHVALIGRDGIDVVDSAGDARRHLTTGGLDGLDWERVAPTVDLAKYPPCAIAGDSTHHTLEGSRFDDDIFGTSTADRIFGNAGSDVIRAQGGADTIYGGAGNDGIDAGPGSDVIIGGIGRDVVRAGTGNDVIRARDGERDTISCGPGRDTVYADQFDRVAKDCERVLRKRVHIDP
jgi:RTX calcium-binding nonapeptide repeat (4 copies)/WD40-like Beta Propeller Repeat